MRVIIVYNPTAGGASDPSAELAEVAGDWRARGWEVVLRPTAGSGDGTAFARDAVQQGYDMVVAAGGDGTINEVVNGLAGTQTILGALPLGTMNVWARELGLPLQLRGAAQVLAEGVVRAIDLGRAGERYFLLMAGVGFDASITAAVRPQEKRRLGALAYVLRGFSMMGNMRGTKVQLVLDGRPINGRVLWMLVGNTQLYGGLLKITHRASMDDGLLDVCVIQGENLYSAPWHFITLMLRRYDLDPEITYYRARRVEVRSRKSLPVQVDGDPIGQTPMTFEVVPGALRVLMPPRVSEGLLQAEAVPQQRPRRSVLRLVTWLRRTVPGLTPASRKLRAKTPGQHDASG